MIWPSVYPFNHGLLSATLTAVWSAIMPVPNEASRLALVSFTHVAKESVS